MQITIKRPKQFAEIFRSYQIHVDGSFVAEIKAGEEVSINLKEGAKTLSATIDWCSSNRFSLADIKDNDKLEVKNSIANKIWIPFYPLYAVAFKKNSYLKIDKQF